MLHKFFLRKSAGSAGIMFSRRFRRTSQNITNQEVYLTNIHTTHYPT